jgi:hypothetical protein
MTQWHPVFAQLLRPAVESYYEVQTTVPVGDAPREADIVLLRRTGQTTPPFRGLWQQLTAWNILEFKGPTVSPRRRDIDLLVELGLGIDRRLRAERGKPGQRKVSTEEVSFWYLANRLGGRFLQEAQRKLGPLEPLGPGLWRCRLLGRLVLLVSSVDLPVDEDSLPLHIVGQEPLATERQVAQLVVNEPILQQLYGGWVASLHPAAWKEVEAMARTAGKHLRIDLDAAIDAMGIDRIIEQVGMDRVLEHFGMDRLLAHVGMERVLEQMGKKELLKRMGPEGILANLSPADRRELKRLL